MSKYKILEERAKIHLEHYKGKVSYCERIYEHHNAELEKHLPISQLDIQNLSEKDIRLMIEDNVHRLTTEIEKISNECKSIDDSLEVKYELKLDAARWEELNTVKKTVENKLAQFEQILGQEEQIKVDTKRYEDIKLNLPILENLILSRSKIQVLIEKLSDYGNVNTKIEKLNASLREIEDIRNESPHWQRYYEERGNWHQIKTEIVNLENEASEITDKISNAETVYADKSKLLMEAEVSNSAANKKYQQAEFELKEAKNKKVRFSTLEGKAECDSCGQLLTEEHRISESAKITEMLADAEKRNFNAKEEYEIAYKNSETLRKEIEIVRKQLEQLGREIQRKVDSVENSKAKKYQTENNAMASLALISESANKQFGKIENIKFCFEQIFPTDVDLSNMQRQSQKYNEQKLELEKLRKRQTDMAVYQGQVQELKPTIKSLEFSLPKNWKKEADNLTETSVEELRSEKILLNQAPQKLSELQEAKSQKSFNEQRLNEIIKDLDNIREDAKHPASVIEEEINKLRLKKAEVEREKITSESEKSKLENQQKARIELEKEQKEVRHKAALYRELTNLLGREKLQRWLLLGAEKTIVHNANNFLERISNRSIELKLNTSNSDDGSIEAGKKALDLLANYQIEEGNYVELPVDSLSGGQRFRVAVSLALGIGQYASTGTRRLESVIIDEGFGSLDADGRNEMIDEIKSLKDVLQRIIIVSHQEEVSKAFPTNKYLIEKVNGSSTVALVDGND